MNAILQSFLLVFASEMGDKTQLLALLLAARFRRPWTIMAGILAATLVNHGLASWAGSYLGQFFSQKTLVWGLALTFFAFAAWILVPDEEEEQREGRQSGVFFTTVITFFLAEMGDKTQLATLVLGTKFANAWLVTAGTTLGMLAADGLAVFFGEKFTARVPMKYVRWFASALFALFGLGILFGF